MDLKVKKVILVQMELMVLTVQMELMVQMELQVLLVYLV